MFATGKPQTGQLQRAQDTTGRTVLRKVWSTAYLALVWKNHANLNHWLWVLLLQPLRTSKSVIYTTRRINTTLRSCEATKHLACGGHSGNVYVLPLLFPRLTLPTLTSPPYFLQVANTLLWEIFCSSLNYPLFIITLFIIITHSNTIPISTSESGIHLYSPETSFLSRCQQL